jgi:hypothetical protein
MTVSRGTLVAADAVNLTGQSVTASKGTLSANSDGAVTLTGQAVTAARGTLAPSSAVPLTGSSVTVAAGTPLAARSAALTGLSTTASIGTLAPSTSVSLTGASVTVSKGAVSTGAIGSIFSGVQGVWLCGTPIENFQRDDLAASATVAGYSTRASYGANGTFGRWRDLSGNANDATQTNDAQEGAPLHNSTWDYIGNVFDDLSVPNIGGSTTGFYFAAALGIGSYYGTLYSDKATATGNTGIRIYHTADGDGSNGLHYVAISAGSDANHASDPVANPQGVASSNPTKQVLLTVPAGTNFHNGDFTPFVVQFYYDGTYFWGRLNGDAWVRSSASVTLSAGSTTARLNSNRGVDYGNSGTDFYDVVVTKNFVPSSTQMDAVLSYLTQRSTSGATAALTGVSLTTARGTLVPQAGAGTILTGKTVTPAAGAFTPSLAVPLIGQSVTVSTGTPLGARSAPLTGQSVTAAAGTLSAGVSVPLVGKALAVSKGAFPQSGFVAVLLGQQASVAAGQLGAEVFLPWAGVDNTQDGLWTPVPTPQTPGWQPAEDAASPAPAGWTKVSS